VRALFTFVGGAGHFDPLVPVARAMRAAGHTVAFTAHPLMPADIRAAVADVLERPGYRRAAERMRDELAALPGVEHAVGLLEALAVR